MALQALLFSRDQQVIDLVREVLKTLDIEVSQCSVGQEAVQRLKATRFDTIIVDNADASGAVMVLAAAKTLLPAKNPSVLCWQFHATASDWRRARAVTWFFIVLCPRAGC